MSEILGDKLNIVYEGTLLEITPELMKKTIVNQNKEIERLNNIINEAIKYIRSNEWGIDYEHSNCRTHLLDILKGSDKK